MQRAATQAAAAQLAARVVARERRALADAVTVLEQGATDAAPLLAALLPALGHALIVGITGPPGAGKSTLANALIAAWRAEGRRVGVIAVDPSSPISGGAILGDRVRMTAGLDDDGVYIRSLAARGALGGLSPAAVRVIDALDAGGFDRILLETVGTGQNEIDVAEIADVRIVVSAPGLGDAVQAIKAGLLEIADIMVVNKADRDGAEQTAEMLTAALRLQPDRAATPILQTSAMLGDGIAALVQAIAAEGVRAVRVPAADRRRRRARYLISRRAIELAVAAVDHAPPRTLAVLSDDVLAGRTSVDAAARQLLSTSLAPRS